MHKVDIMICSKDRPTEIALLLQSLRTQTFQEFDVYIYDDRSGVGYQNHHFLASIFNRMKLENHKIKLWRNDIPQGVTKLRKIMAEKVMEEGVGDLILRLDDDNILQADYIERLVKVIDSGYDIASGVVPNMAMPFTKRDTKFVKPFISDVRLNKEGNIEYFGDDCGMEYIQDEIIPSPNFRSLALIKKEVHKQVEYESNLGFCSFREEQFFSFKALIKGFKIAVDTGAIAYHLQTPSGGERTPEYQNGLNKNHELLNELTRKLFLRNGNFLEEYRNGK